MEFPKSVIFRLSVLFFVFNFTSISINAQTMSGVNPVTYTEGSAPVIMYPNFTFSGGSNYGGGYMLFDITNGNAQDQLGIFNDPNPNALNAISVVGTGVFLGNGTGTDIIGSIDPIMNGINGQDLKINFTSNFQNSGFENGLAGWSVVNQNVNLGVTSIGGYTTPETGTYPANAGNDDFPGSMSYSSQVVTNDFSEGTHSLRIWNSGSSSSGCDVIHGGYALSDPFQANNGDILYFDWRAVNGSDAYDVFGYLLNVNTGATTIIIDQTGGFTTPWTTASVTVPSNGTYRFVFVSGTYDATCGYALGASLYIDNFIVANNLINPSIIQILGRHVTYANACGTSDDTRNITVSVVNATNITTSASSTISINTFNPVITCPANIIVNSPANQCGASVYFNATATDNCPTTISYSLPSGSTFPVGTTTVTAIASDSYGNNDVCTFNVTVQDVTPPIFVNCPTGFMVDVFTNDCVTSVFWAVPTATDNCGLTTVTQTSGIAQGSIQGPGVYPVTYVATDGATPPNTSATCSFNINVIDTENPVIINCPYNAQEIFVDAACNALLPDYAATMEATDNCGYSWSQSPAAGAGPYTAGDVVSVTVTATDAALNFTNCTFNVNVLDDIAPTITCPTVVPVVNDPGVCGAMVTFANPVLTDNCVLPMGMVGPLNFTTAGAFGPFGPTQAQINAAYVGTDLEGQVNIVTQGIQEWIVPVTGTYLIQASGAQGGSDGGFIGGLGADISGEFDFTAGDVLRILVGQQGNNSGGGGATFITTSTNTPLVVAGGGAGTGNGNGGNGRIDFGGTGTAGTGEYIGCGASGGGGFYFNALNYYDSRGGYSFINGGLGGVDASCDGSNSFGGFGGGASGGHIDNAGGGGGYNGGYGKWVGIGQGGSSFNSGINQVNVAGSNTGNGLVTIELLAGGPNALAQIEGLPSGSLFPVGTTTNTFVVTDAAGNTAECSFDVTVTDNEAPVVDCTGLSTAITTSAGGTGDCEGQYTWTVPTPSDNCGVINYTVTYTNPDGSIDGPFNAFVFTPQNPFNGSPTVTRNFSAENGGVSTVTYYVEDAAGNTNTCSFTVTVTDDETPVFDNCPPAGYTVDVFTNDCITDIIWNIPTATDNCSVTVNQTGGPLYGSQQGPGNYTITYTATDNATPIANTATCSFTIEIADTENPIIQNCPYNNLEIFVDNACEALLPDYTTTINAFDNCGTYTTTQSPLAGAGPYAAGDLVPVIITVTDAAGNSSTCAFDVDVLDDIDPVITCPADITMVNDPGVCGAVVAYELPIATDNCELMLLPGLPEVLFVSDNGNITEIPAALTAEGYSVTTVLNDYNTLTAENTVLQGDLSAYDLIIWHQVGDGYGDVITSTTANNLEAWVQAGGKLFVTGYDVIGSPTDNILAVLLGGTSGADFGGNYDLTVLGPGNSLTTGLYNIVGTTIYSVGDWDDLNGLTAETVDVVGDSRWSLRTVPGGGQVAFVSTHQWGNSAFPEWNTPGSGYFEALRNFAFNASGPGGPASLVQTSGFTSGSTFPVGTTVNTFVVTDPSGNSATCSFEITVTDEEDPVIVCPSPNVVITTSNLGTTGDCAGQYAWIHPTPTDNCGIESYTVSYLNPNGTIEGPNNIYQGSSKTPISAVNRNFEVGITTVTYFVEDIHGNTNTCSFTVTVTDDENPVFDNCPPAGYTVDVFTNECVTDIFWFIPTATDNCGATVAQTAGPAYGSSVGPGSYYIEYVATDAAGLTDTCSFTILVQDTENPVIINCPYNAQEIFVDDLCEALLPDYSATMQAEDNCGYTWSQVPLPGTAYTAGDVVTVTVTATDAAGNFTECTFIVNVLDTISPTIECPIDIVTVNDPGVCGAVVEYDDPLVDDNCGINITPGIETFIYTGAVQTWTVPAGVNSIFVDLRGASGGSNNIGGSPNQGNHFEGLGGRLVGNIPVTPGDVIYINVGGQGNTGTGGAGGTGGFNGGGNAGSGFGFYGGGGGGGASDIRIGGNTISDRKMVAGGGAGEAYDYSSGDNGGNGGDLIGAYGTWGGSLQIQSGLGGTQSLGGAGGSYFGSYISGTSGSLGFGGNGGTDGSGGGGGGGYYGGGGGAWAGGGGGSSYTDPSVTDVFHTQGYQSGDGQINIQYNQTASLILAEGLPSGSTFPVGTTTNTFVVTDASGNTATCSFDVTVTDEEIPVIDCSGLDTVSTTSADGITGNCTFQYSWTHPLATDNCAISNYTVVYQNPDGTVDGPYNVYVGSTSAATTVDPVRNFEVGITTVTYYVEDIHGNTNTCSFTVTVTDDEFPVWDPLPQNLTIECDGTTDPYFQIQSWLNTNGGGIASDNCGVVTYSNDYTGLVVGCSQYSGSAFVIFTATDQSNNSTPIEVTLTVVDKAAPIIVTPARDTIVECNGQGNTTDLQSWLDNHGGAFATDICSGIMLWEYELISTTEGCGGTSVSRYAFRAIDACDNVSVNTEATFTIVDTSLPVFDVLPQDTIVQCDGSGNQAQLMGWLSENAGLVASDLCSGIENISFDLVKETDLCGLTATYLYRFTIVDGCGNANTAEATFAIVDTLPPVITGGADMDMEECQNPPAGNYPEFDFWLTNNAGATAEDGCGEFTWTNDFVLENWKFECGNTKFVDVWFYATDVCGNVDSVMFTFRIGDVTPPEFTNCPRPDIVVDVPTNLCESYVNFSMPLAIDNCSGVTIEQTDTTGLTSGDLFPVGCTILEYTATDSCGNQTICRFRVIVNDNHTPPVIECPADIVTINDPGLCGVIIDSLDLQTSDNCPGNVSVTYEVYNESGVLIGSGIETASGTEFPVGNNTVVYTAYDQPRFMITEIVQDGIITGVEIGNFGPAAIELGCMEVRRENSSADELYIIPHGTVVAAGNVFVRSFTNIPAGEIASYTLRMKDRLIDSVTINDGLDGVDIFRISPIDTDTDADFEVGNSCYAGSFGIWNPQLPSYADNGTVTGMQSVNPNVSTCQFMVDVTDEESPTCGLIDTITFSAGGLLINGVTCTSSVFTMPAGKIADINMTNLDATVLNAGLVTVTLTSPDGRQITLLDGICNNTANIDVQLDDKAPSSVALAGCSPLGNGSMFAPLEAFNTFFGEESLGQWTLELYSGTPNSGMLNNWTIEFLLVTDYDQDDMVVENDPGLCGAEVEWTHPYFLDNCIDGTMTVTYSFSNAVTGETSEETEIVLNSDGTIDLDGTVVTRYFKVGVTEITYTLTDAYGHISHCGFTITVNDTEAPVFASGCEDRTIYLDPGDCYGAMNTFPVVTDNCEVATLEYEDQNGGTVDVYYIHLGDNTIYAIATDIYGNKDTCIFIVHVIEYIPDNEAMACNDSISISLDANCYAELNADMILEGNNYRCYENYCITIVDESGNVHPNAFGYNDVGQSFMVTITDCLGSGNSCMGQVTVVEKFAPEIVCPADTVLSCNADIGPEQLGYVTILNCEPFAEILYSDDFIDNGPCGTPRALIVRTWSVNDHQGNIVSCNQNIEIKRSQLDEVKFPVDILDLDCAQVAANPNLTKPGNTGYPKVDGIPINYNTGLCMFSFLYTDEIYYYCGNSYEILRTWKVRDMCGPVNSLNPRRHVQLIQVFDNKPPKFHECQDIEVDAGAYICSGELEIPVPMIEDNCNAITLSVTVNGAAVKVTGNYADGTMKILAYNLGLGNHPARFIAKDACNNKSVCVFNIHVVDKSPPIPVCEQYKTVSLTTSGIASIDAKDFDSGSFDNCNDVYYKVLRVNGDLVYDGGCPELNGDDKPHTSTVDVWYDDEVFFCCEDVGNEVMVSLRVFDKDPGEGPVDPLRMNPGGDLYGHYNDCWSIVKIECKVPPVLICEDVSISCESSLDPDENPALQIEVSGVCDYELSYTDARDNGVCKADIVRTWIATGCEKSTQCKQRITVTGDNPFNPCTIVFPSDKSGECSKDIADTSLPLWDENPCNVVTAEIIREDTFTFVDGACYKILREWAVIDWCVYKNNTGAEQNVDAINGRKLNCNALVLDGYYRYTQVMMMTDLTPPEISVDDQCIGTTDCYASNVTMKAIASDTCNTNEEYWWKYIVVNMDTWETVQYSYNYIPKPDQGVMGKRSLDKLDKVKEAKLVVLNGLPIGNYRVTWTVGDGCGNATSKEQYFRVADKKAPTPVLVDIATAVMENGMVALKARWFDKGGCGDGCISSFDNCTPQEGLYFTYTAVLPDLATEPAKWANQLAQYGKNFFDPETGAISTEAKYLNGKAHAWYPESRSSEKLYLCEYIESEDTTITEQVYVWDKFGMNDDCDDANFDFGNVQLNLNHCGTSLINGTVWLGTEGFEEMTVTLSGEEQDMKKITEEGGNYGFSVASGQYKIRSSGDFDFLRGVSTLDIVIIQKYILGLKQITDPYLLIAADANGNKKITASDILELRKTLLGLKERFENNSWVGIGSDYEFINPARAFEEGDLARIINVQVNEDETINGLDFNTIKIGDLNNSNQYLEGRSSGSLMLMLDDISLVKEEKVEIPVYAKNFSEIEGFQFTLNSGNLQITNIKGGALELTQNNYSLKNDNLLVSWNGSGTQTVADGEVLFTLIADSKVDGMLSSELETSDDILRSESYKGKDLEIMNVKLGYRSGEFVLYQNQPNPFSRETVIGFELPSDNEYIMRIYDMTGKEIYETRSKGKKGFNSVTVEKDAITTSGVYYYRLESGDNIASRKMIFYR